MESKLVPTPKSTDEYIALLPPFAQKNLNQLRQLIKKAAPEAEETFSYQMPAYKFHGLLVWFAAAKNHFALYPKANVIEAFKDKLIPYSLSKGTIRFPYNKPLPEKLIIEIIEFRVKENLEKELAGKNAKKKTSL
jgi:uncharacterized protein YdhG (YjbR/CyaY superfamily)